MPSQDNHPELYKKLLKLRQEVQRHNYLYHVMDAPVISDYEYDQLILQIRQIESDFPEWITPDSPTQRAGAAPADKFVKVAHPAAILSLANAFTEADVYAWQERISKIDDRVCTIDFVVEPKIDGLTIILHYRDGKLMLGATRGDGVIGEDITSNLRTVRAIPLQIPLDSNGPKPPSEFIVRGEAYIPLKDFNALNKGLEEAGEKTYLNPRNTAAGSLRQLDPGLTAKRPIKLLAYAIVSRSAKTPATQWETLAYLRALGFPVPQGTHCPDLPAAIEAYNKLVANRDDLPYEADGAVIKINDLRLAEALGIVGKDPRGAIAFKFPAREVTTRLLNIGVNVGRTGVLTPYAMLEAVEVGGVVVRQATLHNFDYIAEKDIRVGDRVAIKRAGDVIPYVIGPIKELRNGSEQAYVPPSSCPDCGMAVEHFEGEVAWYCVNASCPAQLIRNVEHFVSRGAMDIVGLGIKIVVQLVEAGLVRNVADIYKLRREDLLKLEGFADKKADNLLAAIETSRKQPLSRVITALGIRGVGEVMAADLARYYPALDSLSLATMGELQMIEGVGPNIAKGIVDWFSRDENRRVLEGLKMAGVWPVAAAQHNAAREIQRLSGMIFVITGTLPGLSRDDAKELIQLNGGKVTDSVSKNTTYLVVGENPGSKIDKANSLNIKIIDEAGLRKLLDVGEK